MALQRLWMKNFRRHSETEIVFDDTAQLTLISGRNGAGKTTVLEAIRFAYYGEGRTTKTKLDALVRRGAELEGLTVRLDFSVGSYDYQIERRYDSGNSFAQLRLDGEVVAQGSREVTQEVSRLFGMDSRGFSLAAFASQKQLDGLTSMAAGKRAQTISRLMRADVFTKARDEARTELTTTKRVLRTIGEAPDVAALTTARDTRQVTLQELVAARDVSAAAAANLVGQIDAGADVQATFKEASAVRSRAEGAVAAAEDSLERAQAQLTAAEAKATPRPDTPKVDTAALYVQLSDVMVRLEQAKDAERAKRDRQILDGEISSLQEELASHHTLIENAGGCLEAATAVHAAEKHLQVKQEALASTRQEHERLRSDHAVLTAQLASAQAALEKTRSLDAECVTCHQSISADHRHTQEQMHLDTVEALQAKLDSTVTDLATSAGKLNSLETAAVTAQRALTDAQLVEQQVVQTVRRVEELERTAAVLTRRRDALPLEGEPVDVVASERMTVEGQINAARAAEQALLDWERGTNAVAAAKLSVDQATLNLDRARAALAGTEIPTDLLEAVERLSALANQLAAEQELLNALEIEAIRAEQHLATAQDRLDAAEAETARRKKLMDEAEEAEAASRLLNVTASKVTGRIRPSLEGATSAILSTMSEGRFDSVSIANDYSISVRDDGALHPMEELSGGEQDLAALALRLGLAAVVAARHGSPGPGFLVLDEVFGSQDAARRESILSGLRALRRSYPQILLVSHVEGAEDQVDSVLTVERVGDDDGTSVADAVVTSQ